MNRNRYFFVLLYFVISLKVTYSANVLGFFPAISQSHMVLAQALCKGLVNKGHNVTLVSPFTQNGDKNNFHKIKMPDLRSIIFHKMFENTFELRNMWASQNIFDSAARTKNFAEVALNNTNVQKLLQTTDKYDVIIVEMVLNEAHLALGPHFNAPVIAFATVGATAFTNDLVGNPSPYAYVPNFQLPYSDNMTFFQRVINVLMEILIDLLRYILYVPDQQDLVQKYFPLVKQNIYEIMANTSLVLLNSHSSLSYPRPYVPNMIEIGGFHIEKSKPKPLSDDLQQFLDDAPNGVIYFSMGSILKSAHFPEAKRDAFIKAFRQLKEKVLWKWENETIPNQPKNLKLSPWFPQQAILAHPNVKLFITHGGLLSSSEAVYHAVPFIGIPIFGDQHWNMLKAQHMGYSITVDFDDITEESIKNAINTMLNDTSYKKNMDYRSLLLRDQQMHPLDKAIYWVEYVIKHNGAPFTKSSILKLNRFQYLQIDVIIFILTVTFIFVFFLRKTINCICKNRPNTKTSKEKMS